MRQDKIDTDYCDKKSQIDKMDKHSQKTTGIEILEEILGLLRITEDYILDRNRTIELVLEKMSTTPTLVVYRETV